MQQVLETSQIQEKNITNQKAVTWRTAQAPSPRLHWIHALLILGSAAMAPLFTAPATSTATADAVEARLQAAGIELTLGGEPTSVPLNPEGAEWSVAADGPTKLGYAHALAEALKQCIWPDATLLYCTGKRFEGEVNPRWALRLIIASGGGPLVRWPQRLDPRSRRSLEASAALQAAA